MLSLIAISFSVEKLCYLKHALSHWLRLAKFSKLMKKILKDRKYDMRNASIWDEEFTTTCTLTIINKYINYKKKAKKNCQKKVAAHLLWLSPDIDHI